MVDNGGQGGEEVPFPLVLLARRVRVLGKVLNVGANVEGVVMGCWGVVGCMG